jgi:hypothetical protein
MIVGSLRQMAPKTAHDHEIENYPNAAEGAFMIAKVLIPGMGTRSFTIMNEPAAARMVWLQSLERNQGNAEQGA